MSRDFLRLRDTQRATNYIFIKAVFGWNQRSIHKLARSLSRMRYAFFPPPPFPAGKGYFLAPESSTTRFPFDLRLGRGEGYGEYKLDER